MEGVRKRIYQILSEPAAHDDLGQALSSSLLVLIILNVVAIVLESVPAIYERAEGSFRTFEVISVAVFSIEYVCRMWSCTADHAYAHPLLGRLRFALRPLQMVDLLAVLPFYVAIGGADLRFLRMARLSRVFRVAKLTRYSRTLRLIQRVIKEKKEELVVTFFLMSLLIIGASILMYFVEHPAQPKQFSTILAAMWWSVATVTTVGYGDIYPVTGVGKLLASLVALLGIGLFALPAGIITAGFMEELRRPGKASVKCPHCGRQLPE